MPGDVGDKAVVDVRVEALRIKLLLRLLAGDVIVPLAGVTLVFGVAMITVASVLVVLNAVIVFAALIPVSCVIDVCSAVTIGELPVTIIALAPGIGVDALADVDTGV